MILWMWLVLLCASVAHTQEVKGVLPLKADSYMVNHRNKYYYCITVEFDFQSFLRTLVKTSTIIVSSTENNFILPITLHDSNAKLSCITSPMAQFSHKVINWQRITQCYKTRKNLSSFEIPQSITIAKGSTVDLYQPRADKHGVFLIQSGIPIVGNLTLDMHYEKNNTPIALPLLTNYFACSNKASNEDSSTSACENGCIDVCPTVVEGEFVCLNKQVQGSVKQESNLTKRDFLIVNQRSGTIFLTVGSNSTLIPAQQGDALLCCSLPASENKCDYITHKGICMVLKKPCSAIRIFDRHPIHSVRMETVTGSTLSLAKIQPQVDPLLYCLSLSKQRNPSFIAMCVKALMSVSKYSTPFIHQQKLINGTWWEENFESDPKLVNTMVYKKSLQTKIFSPMFIFIEISILTAITTLFMHESYERYG